MGAGVSAGENNDDLVDNLKDAKYIKNEGVERVFRVVDRGEYFLPCSFPAINAYRDVAWKNGNFHISAPCIYSEVLEGLRLEPGLSFLNLGSGTGYLSTMAGLILGAGGVNHGVELHANVVDYSNKKLEEFKKYSGAIDEYDFGEPKFVQGNCLCLASGNHLYDRVYCGAACPETYLNYMKNLLKVGGILIIPLNDQLLEIKRTSDINWNMRSLLAVSFATLVHPNDGRDEMVKLPDVEPLSLQELCRSTVRNILQKIIEIEHPQVRKIRKTPAPQKKQKKKRSKRGFLVSRLTFEDTSDEERDVAATRMGVRNSSGSNGRQQARMKMRNHQPNDDLLKYFFCTVTGKQNNNSQSNRDVAMEVDSSDTDDEQTKSVNNTQEVEAVIEHQASEEEEEGSHTTDDNSIDVPELHNVFVDLMNKFSSTTQFAHDDDDDGDDNETSDSDHEETEEPTTSKKNNREKFDSGLGDEIVESSPQHISDNDIVVTISTDDEQEGKRMKKYSIKKNERGTPIKCRKVKLESSDSELDKNRMKMYKSPYSAYMKGKIQKLPLPPVLKNYLNFYREF